LSEELQEEDQNLELLLCLQVEVPGDGNAGGPPGGGELRGDELDYLKTISLLNKFFYLNFYGLG
jgi:hypothetical protein